MRFQKLAAVIFASLTMVAFGACGDADEAECGNGLCEGSEDSETCPADCTCGDGLCEGSEDSGTCPADCTCGNDVCEVGEDSVSCPGDCAGDHCGNGVCNQDENTINCPQDCTVTLCGNEVCEPGEPVENPVTCPDDCMGQPFQCSDIPAATNAGASCQSDADCEDGLCLNMDDGPRCYQRCVENECGCPGDQHCVTIADENENPIEIAPGKDLGICITEQVGDVEPYLSCVADSCQSGAICATLDMLNSDPFCAPECTQDADCPEREGFAGECVSSTACVIHCDLDNPSCPATLECLGAHGSGVCVPPPTH